MTGHAVPTLTDAEIRRFHSKVRVNPTGCPLTWAPSDRSGLYGVMEVGGRSVVVHRIAASRAGLEVEGVVVRHRCDNPPCVTPDHLETGTQAENIADRVARGRSHRPLGEGNPKAVLTPSKVRTIRAMRETGALIREIASTVGASKQTVGDVLAGKTWTHVGR